MRQALRDTFTQAFTADSNYGREEASRIYDQIATGQPDLIARMMGERQLMMESLVEPIALRMSLDPDTDVRPRVLVHSVHSALMVSWMIGLNNRDLDLAQLAEAALDVLEQGMAHAMMPPSAPRLKGARVSPE
jgi:hypothetical protein